MRGERATRPCSGCGTLLTRLVSQAKGNRWFCTTACQQRHSPTGASIPKEPNEYRGQTDTRPCANCGNLVTRYLSQARLGKPWSCSMRCKASLQARTRMAAGVWNQPKKYRTGDTIPCTVCGKSFYRQPAYIAQGRHLCSRECNAAWQRRNRSEKECPHCGAMFEVKPSQQAIKYCSKRCESRAKIKRPTGREHNGRPVVRNAAGYLTVYEPMHPSANRSGRVLEHRLVMEKLLGRYLTTDEQVNHIDHNPSNNDPSNLEVMSPSDHSKETGAYTRAKRQSMRDKLAAYEAKYGPLME